MELKKYSIESKRVTLSIENFKSALDMDVYLIFLNQLNVHSNVDQSLYTDNVTISFNSSLLGKFNYTRLKESIGRVLKLSLLIEDEASQNFVEILPFYMASYINKKISITLRKTHIPLFLEIGEGYAKYLSMEALRLKKPRTKKLFRILSLYPGRRDNTMRCTMDEFKTKLNISGYKGKPSQFIDQVINYSLNDIRENTSLNVVFRFNTIGDTWVLKFTCSLKGSEEPSDDKDVILDEKQEKAYNKLVSWGVYHTPAFDIALNNCAEFWMWHYNIQGEIGKKIRNPGAVALKHFKKTND